MCSKGDHQACDIMYLVRAGSLCGAGWQPGGSIGEFGKRFGERVWGMSVRSISFLTSPSACRWYG